MTYVLLVAGKGTRLNPLTLTHPKALFKLDEELTVLARMVQLIKLNDKSAKIIIVTGFQKDLIEKHVQDVTFVYNPFYAVTNSIASLWFAKDIIKDTNLTIINGDIVMSEDLVSTVLCKDVDVPVVLIDSSIKTDGDYNVQVNNEKVLVMSKDLEDYYGEYAGVTKLDSVSINLLMDEVTEMLSEGFYDQWYENALVQMIFKRNFNLGYIDICNYDWTEVDSVGDLIHAKRIHEKGKCVLAVH